MPDLHRLSRKQREIREREQRILEVASRLLGDGGYLGVTMERIAAAIEYSRGTVYQHFGCKEEVMLALTTHRLASAVELFRRASAFPGSTRERITAIGEAYDLFTRLYPVEFRNLPTLLSPSIWAKTTPQRQGEFLCQDGECMQVVTGVVDEAITAGDLDLPDGFSPADLVFGLWSAMFGALSLMQTAIPFAELGVAQPRLALHRNLQALLDGVGWRPPSAEFDAEPLIRRVREELFAAEWARVADTGAAPNEPKEAS